MNYLFCVVKRVNPPRWMASLFHRDNYLWFAGKLILISYNMVKKSTRLAIQAKERAEIEEIEKSRLENNGFRGNGGHCM